MPEPVNDRLFDALVGELYPLATQAARIVAHLADTPVGMDSSDRELSSRLGDVSAEHVAIVRRSLIENGLAVRSSFATRLVASASVLTALADNLRGIAAYLRVHKDRDAVRLVLTEPGLKSALRRAIDDAQALPPLVFQTSDAFFNLARGAKQELVILSPFMDPQGAELMVELFSLCRPEVRRVLISRPLAEPARMGRKSGPFAMRLVSGLRICRSGGRNRRKSPAVSGNIVDRDEGRHRRTSLRQRLEDQSGVEPGHPGTADKPVRPWLP